MKKTILGAMLAAASLLCLGGCGQHSRVDELKDFVEKVQKEGNDYTEEQWQEVNAEFTKLLNKLNDYKDLSPEEVKEIAKYQADKTLEQAGAALEGALEGLTGDDETEDSEN